MKVRIELTDNEEEIVIKCKQIDSRIQSISQYVHEQIAPPFQLTFYKDDQEYFFPTDHILFFETNNEVVYAHTEKEAYKIKMRLYELEEGLPNSFIRISKSTILNMKHIHSISKNITSASLVKFQNSHKEVYVSRMYYKKLKYHLQGRSYL